MRWATTIENVLWIVNVDTSRATPANIRRKVSKKSRKSAAMSASSSAVRVLPVTASMPEGSVGWTAATSCSGETPAAAVRLTALTWSSLCSSRRCAVSVSNHV